ncbi:MAG: hypothetical protein CL868_03810 [Cytophagaceae bacterium]|nr:hypothetical protein [Cytophagaceae bacterium]|tara:strand:+ start:519 stop:1847 length:1329 start_codon:yes stop_codon:yes gene_type:complete
MEQLYIKLRWLFNRVTNKIAFYPTLLTLCGLVLGFVMLFFEDKGGTQWLYENAQALFINDAETARSLLSTFIAGIFSLMVFSFSMVMVLLSQASSNYSPRILPGLIRSKKHQYVLGFYMGVLTYCILILLSVKPTDSQAELPGLAILFSIILVLNVLACFIYFIHSISEAIQINNIIEDIFQKSKTRLLTLIEKADSKDDSDFPDTSSWKVFKSEQTGYLQTIDEEGLLDLCKDKDCKIDIIIAKGSFTVNNTPIARCDKELDEKETKRLISCFGFSRSEIVSQNYVLGFKQLTEIAVKAMSPGINDPGTANSCLDYLNELFALRMRKHDYSFIRDGNETKRIALRTIDFYELMYFVFSALREYCKKDALMMHKMLHLLHYLMMQQSVEKSYKEELIKQVNALLEDGDKFIDNSLDRASIEGLRQKIAKDNPTSQQVTPAIT